MTVPYRQTKTDNQVWENSKAIEQGIQAARQHNWLLVTRYLQQLSLNNKKSSNKLALTTWKQEFNFLPKEVPQFTEGMNLGVIT